MIAFEICVDTPDGITQARVAGADRIELCSALDFGGLTPGPGLLDTAKTMGLPAHAMVRPRGGSFICSSADRTAMLTDVRQLRRAGVAGVVVGAALPDGRLDMDFLAELKCEVGPLDVTLHRVFDLTPDPIAALEMAIELGATRILTSGQASKAGDGVDLIARLVRQAGGRIEIMAGGGVTAQAVPALIHAGVDAIHASCSTVEQAGGLMALGSRRLVDASKAAAIRHAIRSAEAETGAAKGPVHEDVA